ncbi:hypothetical protein OG21DRAFT_1524142 [Imleria badia]|nr:hypothetical protein OG21DRAFT_1524142 [Imleria badia]
MPTGSGKNLAFFAALLLNPSGMFIIMTPFVALMEDMCQRLTAYSISGGKWSSEIDPFEAKLVTIPAHECSEMRHIMSLDPSVFDWTEIFDQPHATERQRDSAAIWANFTGMDMF